MGPGCGIRLAFRKSFRPVAWYALHAVELIAGRGALASVPALPSESALGLGWVNDSPVVRL